MTTRRLAAILAADVVGFSPLMERDERERRRAIREVSDDELVGALRERTTDGWSRRWATGLLEFASPVAAVTWATVVQARWPCRRK